MHLYKHFLTVIKHKHYVFKYAKKLHIPWIGFLHDLSKFSFTEFYRSAKYFAGDKTPVYNERKDNNGISEITLHHAKRNKHHWHYYVDYLKEGMIIAPINYKHSLEYVCDIMAASKVYNKQLDFDEVYQYFESHSKTYFMHPLNKEFILWCVYEIKCFGFKKMKKKYTKAKYNQIKQKYKTAILIPYNNFSFQALDILNNTNNNDGSVVF